MRKIAFWLGGLLVVVGSFLLTTWILSRNMPSEAPLDTQLVPALNLKFTDEKSLAVAAEAAGFHLSSALIGGRIDKAVRIDSALVKIDGWVIDLAGDGSPVRLNAFVNGSNVGVFQSDGPRADITASLAANRDVRPEVAKNTKFEETIRCRAGEILFVIATTPNKNYLPLPPAPSVCP